MPGTDFQRRFIRRAVMGGLQCIVVRHSGRWLGSEPVAEGSYEIPAAQELFRRAPIEGSLVTADALHTQTETARLIVQERGADYLFTVKGNQKGVADAVRQLHRNLSHAFSPSGPDGRRPDL